ncbi:MAG: DNA-binding protein WhiA [Clostridia bacterium]|nr:DNA-binding protein WhiA [Clostridia bacterium]
MSFTQNIKENISKITNQCPLCDISELSALCKLCINNQAGEIFISTENEAVAERIQNLFKRVFKTDIDYKNKNGNFRFYPDFDFFTETMADRLMLFGSEYKKIVPKDCCRQAYVRGAFLGGGSVSNPDLRYHMEFDARYEVYANQLLEILKDLGISAKITYRKGRYIVYIKGYEQIAGVLGIIGDVSAAMEFYNTTIEKDLRNNANRRANCEVANIDKIAKTAAAQIKAIRKLEKTPEFSALPESLKEMARLRIENPFDSLLELSEKTNPHIGKSGVNHRLKKITDMAEKL